MKNVFVTAFRTLTFGTALALLAGAATQTRAQGSTGPTPTPTAVPLDGGASLLLAGGVAYGVRLLRRRK